MEYIKEINRSSEVTVFITIHDLAVAGHYCDRLVLINSGEIVSIGKPESVLKADLLSMVYGTDLIVVSHPSDGSPMIIPKFLA